MFLDGLEDSYSKEQGPPHGHLPPRIAPATSTSPARPRMVRDRLDHARAGHDQQQRLQLGGAGPVARPQGRRGGPTGRAPLKAQIDKIPCRRSDGTVTPANSSSISGRRRRAGADAQVHRREARRVSRSRPSSATHACAGTGAVYHRAGGRDAESAGEGRLNHRPGRPVGDQRGLAVITIAAMHEMALPQRQRST